MTETPDRNGAAKWLTAAILAKLVIGTAISSAAEPLQLHPTNPQYFLFRGQPTVLVGNSEHYGSVLNSDFDYRRYLDTVKADGLNVTRLFMGTYREPLETLAAGQAGNTLAPKPNRFLAPWPRSNEAGAADGLNKFDLNRWDGAYFKRLKDFVNAASERGVVVEVALFSNYYDDQDWENSPLNAKSNINGIGNVALADALSLKDPRLLAVEDALVRKIVTELRDFDNVYYEICNEPWITEPYSPVPVEWQIHIAATIVTTESTFPAQHLIAQEFVERVQNPVEQTSLYMIRGAPSAEALAHNDRFPIPKGVNETGYLGTADSPYRIQAWVMFVSGGALFLGLDYSFIVGHEDGSFVLPTNQLGGGSQALRSQLGVLLAFIKTLDILKMAPSDKVIKAILPDNTPAYALADIGQSYVIYIHQGRSVVSNSAEGPNHAVATIHRSTKLTLNLPSGTYDATWINTKTGRVEQRVMLEPVHDIASVESPQYYEDIALAINRED
jgi:Cellulase (glycosyl hydrolase family 5)